MAATHNIKTNKTIKISSARTTITGAVSGNRQNNSEKYNTIFCQKAKLVNIYLDVLTNVIIYF